VIDQWPDWIDPKQGRPVLMLYSVVDDRSGVAYQEYHCVYGEDVEAALRFLFRAMAAKDIEGFPFQGIPGILYIDNGPIARSQVFQRVMKYLGIEIRTHMPRGKDGRRTTSRSKSASSCLTLLQFLKPIFNLFDKPLLTIKTSCNRLFPHPGAYSHRIHTSINCVSGNDHLK
jgi:hypothetical protein